MSKDKRWCVWYHKKDVNNGLPYLKVLHIDAENTKHAKRKLLDRYPNMDIAQISEVSLPDLMDAQKSKKKIRDNLKKWRKKNGVKMLNRFTWGWCGKDQVGKHGTICILDRNEESCENIRILLNKPDYGEAKEIIDLLNRDVELGFTQTPPGYYQDLAEKQLEQMRKSK